MFDRPVGGQAAVLVGLGLGQRGYSESVEELRLLALSAGLAIKALLGGSRSRPDSATFAGSRATLTSSQGLMALRTMLPCGSGSANAMRRTALRGT